MAGVKPLLETIGALLPKLKAWHTSPHDFEKFDITKLRTGQGQASFGEGIYKAESPAVSGVGGEYWDEFARHPEVVNKQRSPHERIAFDYLMQAKGDRAKAIEWLETTNKNTPKTEQYQPHRDAAALLQSNKQVGPRTYEVGINAKPEQILDWDAPLSAQPSQPWKRLDPLTREVIDERTAARGENAMGDALEAYTGKELYQALKSDAVQDVLPAEVGRSSWLKGDTTPAFHTMQYLNSIDLPVTQYLDQFSRRIPERLATAKRAAAIEARREIPTDLPQPPMILPREGGTWTELAKKLEATPLTRNYVTRNDEILEILRKLAIPGMVGGAASVYQPQGQQ